MPGPKVDLDKASAEAADLGPVSIVPRCSTVEGFALEAGATDGVAIESLDTGTVVILRTNNSEYRLTVLDEVRRTVLVKGGLVLQEATLACLQGSSAGGSFLKTGWIGLGLRVELTVGCRRIVTSPVRSITVERLPPRPSDVGVAA